MNKSENVSPNLWQCATDAGGSLDPNLKNTVLCIIAYYYYVQFPVAWYCSYYNCEIFCIWHCDQSPENHQLLFNVRFTPNVNKTNCTTAAQDSVLTEGKTMRCGFCMHFDHTQVHMWGQLLSLEPPRSFTKAESNKESNQKTWKKKESGLTTLKCLCQGRCLYFHTLLSGTCWTVKWWVLKSH